MTKGLNNTKDPKYECESLTCIFFFNKRDKRCYRFPVPLTMNSCSPKYEIAIKWKDAAFNKSLPSLHVMLLEG